jgi:hypothetical protein
MNWDLTMEAGLKDRGASRPRPANTQGEYLMKTRLIPFVSILLIAGLMTSYSVLAQNADGRKDFFGGPPSTGEILDRLSEALDLSDEQAVSMLVVLQEAEARRQALREETASLMGPEICAQKADTEAAILAILTAEQAEQFQQMHEERKARAEERGNKRGRRGPIDCSQYEGG